MGNTKFLKSVILILVLINIGTLSFLWLNRSPHHQQGPREVGNYLMQVLHFSPDQRKTYEALREEHRTLIEPARRRTRELHDAYFNLLGVAATDSATVIQLADSMIQLQKEIELSTYYHFKKVRALCSPDQQKIFDEVISEALSRMAPRPPRH